MGSQRDEYLRRNLLHCKAVGARALANTIAERVHGWSRPPHWLVLYIAELQNRLDALPPELAAYRDEINPYVKRGDMITNQAPGEKAKEPK